MIITALMKYNYVPKGKYVKMYHFLIAPIQNIFIWKLDGVHKMTLVS